MTTIDITLPFRRTYRVENGCSRRTIEEFTVSLRDLAVSDLDRVVRGPSGRPLLGYDGLALHYIGSTRETASFDALRRHMAARARYAGGKPHLTRAGTRPKSGIVDDGEAGVLSAVAETQATFVVVEGCVAHLNRSQGTRIGIRGFRYGRSGAASPWLDFPFARQAQALAVSRALRKRLAAPLPTVRIVDAPIWEILDAGAAERMAVRSGIGRGREWAEAMLGHVRDVVGLLDPSSAMAFLALRDATQAGASDERLLELLRDAVRAWSEMRMPDGIGPDAWWPLVLAVAGLTCRLDAMSDTVGPAS